MLNFVTKSFSRLLECKLCKMQLMRNRCTRDRPSTTKPNLRQVKAQPFNGLANSEKYCQWEELYLVIDRLNGLLGYFKSDSISTVSISKFLDILEKQIAYCHFKKAFSSLRLITRLRTYKKLLKDNVFLTLDIIFLWVYNCHFYFMIFPNPNHLLAL